MLWVESLSKDGYAIMHQELPAEVVHSLRESFDLLISDKETLARGVTRTRDWHVVRHVRQSNRLDWEVLDLTPVRHVLDSIMIRLGKGLGRALKTEKLVLNTCGIVTSFPDCGHQVIHRDGPPAVDPFAITVVQA